MPVVSVVITSQRLVALRGIWLNGCGPFEVGVIPNERKESVVRDVQRGKLQGFPLSLVGLGSVSGSYSGSPFVQTDP